MKLKYQAKKHTRFNYGFIGIKTVDTLHLWYHENTNEWISHNTISCVSDLKGCCSHQRCRSKRAFRRKLKKAPFGVKFVLVSKYVGYNIYGVGSKKI